MAERQNDALILKTLLEMKGDMGSMKGEISSELTERLEQHDLRQEARTVRLEEKMDSALNVHIKDDKTQFADHDSRIKRIEKVGVWGGAVVGVATTGLTFKDQIAKVGRFLGLW